MEKSRIHEGDGDPRHGTDNGYRNLGCRCEPCTTAEAEYQHRRVWSRPTSGQSKGDDCAVLGCDNPPHVKKLCWSCYNRWRGSEYARGDMEEFIKIRRPMKRSKTNVKSQTESQQIHPPLDGTGNWRDDAPPPEYRPGGFFK